MNAANFDESNAVLGPPKGRTEDEVRSLCVYRGEGMVISCWKPSQDELDEIQRTGRVWLIVQGGTMQPAEVTGHYPFQRKGGA